jgi:hypothetical protein
MDYVMTNEEEAQMILRFYTEKRIELECQMRGEQFNAEHFEQSFQTMLATDDGKRIIAKMSKNIDN